MVETEPENERMVAYGQQRSDDLHVPDVWWKGATEEEQEVLRQMRTKIKADSGADTNVLGKERLLFPWTCQED
jgi:hypothetical protein